MEDFNKLRWRIVHGKPHKLVIKGTAVQSLRVIEQILLSPYQCVKYIELHAKVPMLAGEEDQVARFCGTVSRMHNVGFMFVIDIYITEFKQKAEELMKFQMRWKKEDILEMIQPEAPKQTPGLTSELIYTATRLWTDIAVNSKKNYLKVGLFSKDDQERALAQEICQNIMEITGNQATITFHSWCPVRQ